MIKILAIETSCDETSVAIVTDKKEILAHEIFSQIDDHEAYGGVVPEIAARAHMQKLDIIIRDAIKKSGLKFSEIDAIAATAGPGLIGGLLVGVMAAKGMALALNKPFIAVNHLEGHALTARLTNEVEFPFLLLLVSGGHCEILIVEGVGKYKKLGGTIDDALGEAFDKVAKMMGLGYPGGPLIEQLALKGDPYKHDFPRSMKGRDDCNFSFSGLKTAIKRIVDQLKAENKLDEIAKADIAASFQKTAAEILEDRLKKGCGIFKHKCPLGKTLVIAGGVAANKYLKNELEKIANEFGLDLIAPPLKLCTDNGAMIAWAAIERFKLGKIDSLNFEPRARWPLSLLSEN